MAFQAGNTPFGIFDNDAQFQADADNVVPWVLQKLGDPTMHVELTTGQIYQCFEEACLEFSAIVNQYQAKSVLTTLLGTPTGSLSGSEQRYPAKLMEFQKRMGEPFGEAAGVNSLRPLYSASITLNANQQHYDLQSLLSGTVGDQRISIKEIYHKSPVQAYRFFGTTSAVNYLHNQFSFESFTPETIFYLLPIWEDVLRGMQFETSNNVRRSHYSYEIHNNVLTIYPTPVETRTLWFKYWLPPEPYPSGSDDKQADGVSNLANVPFGNIQYSKVNSMGKQWIRKMTFALCKEVLGQVRSKMGNIPIPNGELTLNGAELITDARGEQDQLREELKAILDETTYDKLAAKEAEMAENLKRAIAEVPLGIYIG